VSWEEEEETPPQNLRTCTQQRRKLDKYNYSLIDFRCIFYLSTKKIMEEEMNMKYKKTSRLVMDEEMFALKNNDTWEFVASPNG